MRSKLTSLLFGMGLLFLAACPGPRKDAGSPASPVPQELLSGTIQLDEAVQADADPLAVLFLIARNEQGQIVAVKKLLPPFQWPLSYQLTESDAMIAGTELSGKLKLTARLDQDGNANPASPGDILGGTESEWVQRGDKGVRVRLSERLP